MLVLPLLVLDWTFAEPDDLSIQPQQGATTGALTMGLKSLFARLFASHPPAGEGQTRKVYSATDDALYEDNKDILAGYEFLVPLNLRTPLSVLEHHGEVFKGPLSKAPNYTSDGTGGWVLKTKSWAELGGFAAVDLPEGTVASPVGAIKPSEYLPFLKAFRRIVETMEPDDEKVTKLYELPKESPLFRRFWERHGGIDPEFPRSFFYSDLLKLSGTGPKTAKALYEAGFRSREDVLAADASLLLAVKGVGPRLVKQLQAR